MAEIKDTKLATALKQVKQTPLNFAFVGKGTSDGTLLVSKKTIPVTDINKAKAETGGKKVFRGRCIDEGGKLVFELAEEPPSTLAKQLKTVIHDAAGLTLQVETRMVAGLQEVEQQEGQHEEKPVGQAPPPA